MFFYLFSHSVICILNFLLFNVRCVLFHFFHAIVKFCVVFVEEIILGAIPVKYGCISTEITKILTTPTVSLIIYSMEHYSIICISANCFKFYYNIPIIQLRYRVKDFQIFLFLTQ